MITFYGVQLANEWAYRNLLPMPEVKSFIFPGGETQVNVGDPSHYAQLAFVQFDGSDDILTLAMWADACKRLNRKTYLALPYLPGARADRGTPLGAKVYADMINAMGIDKIACLDPHSDVAPALYDRLEVLNITDVFPEFMQSDGIIVPDLGARKRAESVAALLDVPVIQAYKHRDFKTGKLSGFSCDPLPNPRGAYLMVDDICDGGGTFVGLAKELAETQGVNKRQLGLWVTHGIFSQGFDALLDHFAFIYTTDSHGNTQRNHIPSGVSVKPVLETLANRLLEK